MKSLDFCFIFLYFIVISCIFINGFFYLKDDEERVFIGISSILLTFIDGGFKFLLLVSYIDSERILSYWYKASIPVLPITICLFIIYVFSIFVECLECKTDIFLALLFHCHVTYLFARQSISEWLRS